MISKIITAADIKINLESTEREECFAELLEVIYAKHPSLNRFEALSALELREEKVSTAAFPFVAVPHAICKSLDKTAISIGITKKGIEFESADVLSKENPKVNIIFEILFEENDTQGHLQVLCDILRLVSNPDFVSKMINAETPAQAFDVIASFEK